MRKRPMKDFRLFSALFFETAANPLVDVLFSFLALVWSGRSDAGCLQVGLPDDIVSPEKATPHVCLSEG